MKVQFATIEALACLIAVMSFILFFTSYINQQIKTQANTEHIFLRSEAYYDLINEIINNNSIKKCIELNDSACLTPYFAIYYDIYKIKFSTYPINPKKVERVECFPFNSLDSSTFCIYASG